MKLLEWIGGSGRSVAVPRIAPRFDPEITQPQTSAMVPGGIEAGALGRRLASFVPASYHVNTLIAASGSTVNARARYLVRNNGYAMGRWRASLAMRSVPGSNPRRWSKTRR